MDKQPKKKERNDSHRSYLLVVLLLLISISIGFGAMSSTLKIKGNGIIGQMKWDVHFENITERSSNVTIIEPATILGSTTDIEYSVRLNGPGSYYEFDADIKNAGTIDAKLANQPSLTGITAEQDAYTNYIVTYADGSPIRVDDELRAGETKTIKVRIELEKDLQKDHLPTADQQLNLEIDLDYIQRDQ